MKKWGFVYYLEVLQCGAVENDVLRLVGVGLVPLEVPLRDQSRVNLMLKIEHP